MFFVLFYYTYLLKQDNMILTVCTGTDFSWGTQLARMSYQWRLQMSSCHKFGEKTWIE